MRKICAFCNAVILPGTSPDEPPSHGICRSCYNRFLAENGLNVMKFLEMLDAPVFLVDREVNILDANSLALAFVKKPADMVRGIICGKVLDCINACLPEGCGKTPRCPDCTIRNSVSRTYRTGTPVTAQQAVLVRNGHDAEETIHLNVSTRKDGNAVLLRLEPAAAA
jgi:hypothetical protein